MNGEHVATVGNRTVTVSNASGDTFEFSFPTAALADIRLVGQPNWAGGSAPADAELLIHDAQGVAINQARSERWTTP